MSAYLRTHERLERVISDDTADLGKRCDAIAVLLQYPLANGLRMDLRRMYLDFTDRLQEQAA